MNDAVRLSEAICWLRFPLIFFIILLHCFSVVQLEGNHDTYFKVVYPFSLWIGETGVPGFFFISGFLFFLSKKSYTQKLQTRFQTLVIPYVLWNAILLVCYLSVYAAGHPLEINHKQMNDFELLDYLRLFWDRGSFDNGNFVPLLCPFWYIRNLVIMCILSPLFYYLIKYVGELFLILTTSWWLVTLNNAFIPQTILFFCLGAYFSIHDMNPLKLIVTNKRLFLVLFGCFAFADISLHTEWSAPFGLQIHRFALIFNIPALLLLADWCVSRGIDSKLLPNAAFIVFAVHYPIVVILRKVCASKFVDASDSIHILLFFLCVVTATLLSLSIYWLLDRFIPRAKNILSGNR